MDTLFQQPRVMSRVRHSVIAAAAAMLILMQGMAAAEDAKPAPAAQETPRQPAIERAALDVLRAMGQRLSSAQTLGFVAVNTYESPALSGQPLYYTTRSEVTLRRPDHLRVITNGDGPPTEFYYDGKSVVAYDPAVHLTAIASAPPTIDAMAKDIYDKAAIYFPFVDFIVAHPFEDMTKDLTSAFVVGQSGVVGGTVTDMVALANDNVQAEIWIGVTDHLPRMIRGAFPKDPTAKRFETEFSGWSLGKPAAPQVFVSPEALKAPRMAFARPDTVHAQGQPQ